MKSLLKSFVASAAMCGVAASASAANFFDWTGEAGDGLWSTPGNWTISDPGNVPANGARFIANAAEISIDQPQTVGDIKIGHADTTESLLPTVVLLGGELTVTRNFGVGCSQYDIGYVRSYPSLAPNWRGSNAGTLVLRNSDLQVGTSEARAGFIGVGAAIVSQGGSGVGNFTMTNGTFSAYVGDVYVGYSAQNNSLGKGRVDLQTVADGVLDISGSLFVAKAQNSTSVGELKLGTNWTVRVGTPGAATGSLFLGTGGSWGTGSSPDGLFGMVGGSFEAYVSAISMATTATTSPKYKGRLYLTALTNVVLSAGSVTICTSGGNWGDGSVVYGELDASTCTNVTFNAGSLTVMTTSRIYTSRDEKGILRLGRGAGTVGSVTLGNGGSGGTRQYGLIDLKGFQMTLTNEVKVAGCGIVSNDVNGVSSGFALNETATLAQSDGKMYVTFSRDPEGLFKPVSPARAEDCYWGFKWAGDHVTDVQALVDAGKLVVDTTGLSAKFLAKYALYYSAKDDTTYLGVPVVPVGSGMKVLFR